MRISTSQMFRTGINTMNAQQTQLMHLYTQIASNRKIVTPADDPLGAAQAVNVAQNDAMNTRYAGNRNVATQNLAVSETVLGTVTSLLADVRTEVVRAGNGTYSDADRRTLADTLRVTRDNLLAQANATDGNGQYLFSGFRGDTQPYALDASTGTVSWSGDAGQRMIQVDQTRQMAGGDVGTDIFSRAAPGARGYVTQAGAANGGTAVIGAPQITDPAGLAADTQFEITFDGEPLQYSVRTTRTEIDPSTGVPVQIEEDSGPFDFAGPGTLRLDGLSVSISGQPAAGDRFSAEPLSAGGVDVFATLDTLIKRLETPVDDDPVARASLENVLSSAAQSFSASYDNVLTVRASQGARLAELQALDENGDQRGLNFKKQLSGLQDLDILAATAQLSLRQASLEAATLAFRRIQNTSLFAIKQGG